jgi:hypothetical protein
MEKESDDAATDQTDSPTRRKVLRSGVAALGTTLAVPVSASGAEGTSSELRRLQREYQDEETVMRAVESFASDVVGRLKSANDRFFPSVSELSIDTVTVGDAPSPGSPREGTFIGAIEREGTPTAHITVVRVRRDRVFRLVVEPEAERAYCFVRTTDGSLTDIVTAESTAVNTSSDYSAQCDDITEYCSGCCTTFPCDNGIEYKEQCCEGTTGGCYTWKTGHCCVGWIPV